MCKIIQFFIFLYIQPLVYPDVDNKLCVRSFSSFHYELPIIKNFTEKVFLLKETSAICANTTSNITFELLTREERDENFELRVIHSLNDVKLRVLHSAVLEFKINFSSPEGNNSHLYLKTGRCHEFFDTDCGESFKNYFFFNNPSDISLKIYGSCITACIAINTSKINSLIDCFFYDENILNNFEGYEERIARFKSKQKSEKSSSPNSYNCEFKKILIYVLNITIVQIIIFGIFFCCLNRRLTTFFEKKNVISSCDKPIDTKSIQDIDAYRVPISLSPYERTESTSALYSHITRNNKIRINKPAEERRSIICTLADYNFAGGDGCSSSINKSSLRTNYPHYSAAIPNHSIKDPRLKDESIYHEICENEKENLPINNSFEYKAIVTKN
nr:MAG: hypothetical protein [Porcellio scaber clopovirus]